MPRIVLTQMSTGCWALAGPLPVTNGRGRHPACRTATEACQRIGYYNGAGLKVARGAGASERGRERGLSQSTPIVRTTADETTTRDRPREAKGDARGHKRESKEEAREVAARGLAQVFLCLVKFSGEQGPRGTSAVHLIKDGGSGTEHPMSVAGVACNVERKRERSLSEFSPRRRSNGPAGLDPDAGPVAVSRVEMRGKRK